MVEMENDPILQLEPTEVRECRYLDEIPKESMHLYGVKFHGFVSFLVTYLGMNKYRLMVSAI
jgi:hypothetical protein